MSKYKDENELPSYSPYSQLNDDDENDENKPLLYTNDVEYQMNDPYHYRQEQQQHVIVQQEQFDIQQQLQKQRQIESDKVLARQQHISTSFPERYYDRVYDKEPYIEQLNHSPSPPMQQELVDYPLHCYEKVNFTHGYGYYRCCPCLPSFLNCFGCYCFSNEPSSYVQWIFLYCVIAQLALIIFLTLSFTPVTSKALSEVAFIVPVLFLCIFHFFGPIFLAIPIEDSKRDYQAQALPHANNRKFALKEIESMAEQMVKPIYQPQIVLQVNFSNAVERYRIPIVQFKRLTSTSSDQFMQQVVDNCQNGGDGCATATSIFYDIDIKLVNDQSTLVQALSQYIAEECSSRGKIASIDVKYELVTKNNLLDGFVDQDKTDYPKLLNKTQYNRRYATLWSESFQKKIDMHTQIKIHYKKDSYWSSKDPLTEFSTFWGQDYHQLEDNKPQKTHHPRTTLVPLSAPLSGATVSSTMQNFVYNMHPCPFSMLGIFLPGFVCCAWRTFTRSRRVVYNTTSFAAIAIDYEDWCRLYDEKSPLLKPQQHRGLTDVVDEQAKLQNQKEKKGKKW